MEGVVAARRLRKSMQNSTYNRNIGFGDIGISSVRKRENVEGNIGYLRKLKIKFAIKSLITIVLLIICILTNLLFKEAAQENKVVSSIIKAYNCDFSKEEFLEKFESVTYDIYSSINYIFPIKLVELVEDNYIKNIKPNLLNFSFNNLVEDNTENDVLIYTDSENKMDISNEKEEEEKDEEDVKEEGEEVVQPQEQEEQNGVGGGIEEENTSSSISTSDEKINKIKDLNIDINWPVQGTITSRYGVRDKIFEDIGDFHTGLDIANSYGTEIKSATSGKVVKVEYNNKYYGHTIEIEQENVIFKYAHLSEILVKEGDSINIGDIIGKMGSTGYSTGPHLHFEIRYENTKIDPEKLLP